MLDYWEITIEGGGDGWFGESDEVGAANSWDFVWDFALSRELHDIREGSS